MKKANKNNLANVSGGEIVQLESGEFKVVDNLGINVFADGRVFKTLNDAVDSARILNISTEAVSSLDFPDIQPTESHLPKLRPSAPTRKIRGKKR